MLSTQIPKQCNFDLFLGHFKFIFQHQIVHLVATKLSRRDKNCLICGNPEACSDKIVCYCTSSVVEPVVSKPQFEVATKPLFLPQNVI